MAFEKIKKFMEEWERGREREAMGRQTRYVEEQEAYEKEARRLAAERGRRAARERFSRPQRGGFGSNVLDSMADAARLEFGEGFTAGKKQKSGFSRVFGGNLSELIGSELGGGFDVFPKPHKKHHKTKKSKQIVIKM
jgi:hypothetical protein